jgi:serine/threonine protein phosphatase PrpC
VSSALLRGREHTSLGAVELIAEGRVAVALSIGGAPKRYEHTDPNEDAAAFVRGSAGDVLAVADAHYGFEASEVLLENLLASPAVHWAEGGGSPESSWSRHAIAALCDANADILRERRDDASASATTLSLSVIRPDVGWLLYACVGDSHLFTVAGGTAIEVAPCGQRPGFLGDREESPETLEALCRVGALPLAGIESVVLATDGLSERGIGVADPAAAVASAVAASADTDVALRPSVLARTMTETALEAHAERKAGDNIAVACWVR